MLPTILPTLLKIENPLSMKHVQGAVRYRAGTLDQGGNIPKRDMVSSGALLEPRRLNQPQTS